MLAQHRRRWANIIPELGQRLVFFGAACDCSMATAGQTDRQKGQTVPTSVYRYRGGDIKISVLKIASDQLNHKVPVIVKLLFTILLQKY